MSLNKDKTAHRLMALYKLYKNGKNLRVVEDTISDKTCELPCSYLEYCWVKNYIIQTCIPNFS